MDAVSKAQNTQANSRAAHLSQHKWKPGQSGNPGGRPQKKPITEIYEKILRKTKNRKAIEDTVVKLILGGRMSSVLQLREMAERTEGKVVQPVEMDVQGSISLETVLEAKKKAGK